MTDFIHHFFKRGLSMLSIYVYIMRVSIYDELWATNGQLIVQIGPQASSINSKFRGHLKIWADCLLPWALHILRALWPILSGQNLLLLFLRKPLNKETALLTDRFSFQARNRFLKFNIFIAIHKTISNKHIIAKFFSEVRYLLYDLL